MSAAPRPEQILQQPRKKKKKKSSLWNSIWSHSLLPGRWSKARTSCLLNSLPGTNATFCTPELCWGVFSYYLMTASSTDERCSKVNRLQLSSVRPGLKLSTVCVLSGSFYTWYESPLLVCSQSGPAAACSHCSLPTIKKCFVHTFQRTGWNPDAALYLQFMSVQFPLIYQYCLWDVPSLFSCEKKNKPIKTSI